MGLTEILQIGAREAFLLPFNWRFWLVALLCAGPAFLLQMILLKVTKSRLAHRFLIVLGAVGILVCELVFQFHAGRRLLVLLISYGIVLCFLAGVLLAVLLNYLIKKHK
ncbi:MAG TPA: hypothetical protein PL035_02445 [Bacillota bacterium]|nr:hypothetical protein [Bacillota bacterium]HQC35924.1 hypothetical protein [Bacillota bacterium]